MTYALINLSGWLALAHLGALATDRMHPAQAQRAMQSTTVRRVIQRPRMPTVPTRPLAADPHRGEVVASPPSI